MTATTVGQVCGRSARTAASASASGSGKGLAWRSAT